MEKPWIPVLLLLTACSQVPPAIGPLFTAPPAPSPGQALVVVYRVNAFKAGGAETQIYANGRSVSAIRNASYAWAYMPPGSYTFTQVAGQCEVMPLVVNIALGQTLYLRADYEFNLTVPNRCLFTHVESAVALSELATLHSLGHGNDIEK